MFISIWATLQTEMWKRRNALLNLWWGSFGATDEESAAERAKFNGVLRRNPKTDVKEMYHKDLAARRALTHVGDDEGGARRVERPALGRLRGTRPGTAHSSVQWPGQAHQGL